MAKEQLGYGGSEGTVAPGLGREVVSGSGATVALTAKQSGALCLFNRAAGIVYTLPAAVAGMFFDFATTVTITSNAAKVITKTIASEFVVGAVSNSIAGAAATVLYANFNGTSHVAISSNGTTTGGVIGDAYRLTAISATQWAISGQVSGSGAIATPAAAS